MAVWWSGYHGGFLVIMYGCSILRLGSNRGRKKNRECIFRDLDQISQLICYVHTYDEKSDYNELSFQSEQVILPVKTLTRPNLKESFECECRYEQTKISGCKLLGSSLSISNDWYPIRKIVKQCYHMMNRSLMMKNFRDSGWVVVGIWWLDHPKYMEKTEHNCYIKIFIIHDTLSCTLSVHCWWMLKVP